MYFCRCLCVFFFKQKTAYEMRISDWSSDVCSSDLPHRLGIVVGAALELMVAAHVAGAVDLGLLVAFVIALAAHRTGVTADDAIDERVFVDRQFDHVIELAAACREQRIERLGLRGGAGIAVEDQTDIGAELDRKSTRLN